MTTPRMKKASTPERAGTLQARETYITKECANQARPHKSIPIVVNWWGGEQETSRMRQVSALGILKEAEA